MNDQNNNPISEQEEARRVDRITALVNAMFTFQVHAHAASLGASSPAESVENIVESLTRGIAMARRSVDVVQHNELAKENIPLARDPQAEAIAVAACLIAHTKVLLRGIATPSDVASLDNGAMELLGQIMDDRESKGLTRAGFTPIYRVTLVGDGQITLGATAVEDAEMDAMAKKVKRKYGVDDEVP